jgi:hypothetical protein
MINIKLKIFWYEDADGNYLGEVTSENCNKPPENAKYRRSRNPNELREQIFIIETGKLLIESTCTYSTDLVLAMIRPSIVERTRALSRGFTKSLLDFEQAVLTIVDSCEACMNAEAYERGLTWGYPRYGLRYKETNSSCIFCKGDSNE